MVQVYVSVTRRVLIPPETGNLDGDEERGASQVVMRQETRLDGAVPGIAGERRWLRENVTNTREGAIVWERDCCHLWQRLVTAPAGSPPQHETMTAMRVASQSSPHPSPHLIQSDSTTRERMYNDVCVCMYCSRGAGLVCPASGRGWSGFRRLARQSTKPDAMCHVSARRIGPSFGGINEALP